MFLLGSWGEGPSVENADAMFRRLKKLILVTPIPGRRPLREKKRQ